MDFYLQPIGPPRCSVRTSGTTMTLPRGCRHVRNPHYGGHDDHEGCYVSPEGPDPKVFRSTIHDARFPKHFRASNNIVEYNGKTNSNFWLEDYRLTCKAGGANDDLFIIQFLPIYLADSASAWLHHLPRNVINSQEDLREIFTSNFQGTYMHPRNPWVLKGYW
jgi:hypothetical protein